MAEAEINIEKIFKNMMFGKNVTECGYFPERQAENILTYFDWLDAGTAGAENAAGTAVEKLDCIVYERLLRQGFRRYSSMAYNTRCQNCRECIPIRIPVKTFAPSKSQRRILHKNEDVEVIITANPADFCTDEKALMYRNYYNHHNEGSASFNRLTLQEAAEDLKNMNGGYSGVINLDYKPNKADAEECYPSRGKSHHDHKSDRGRGTRKCRWCQFCKSGPPVIFHPQPADNFQETADTVLGPGCWSRFR